MNTTRHPDDALTAAGKLAGPLPGLLIEAEKVAHAFMRGVHGRRRVGMGEAFWQFRPWTPGDQRRDIDWKQTARRDGVFIRQHEWEAAQTLWLWRDASASMNYASSRKLPSKKDRAEVLLLALAILALDGGERAGLVGVDLAPQSHHAAIHRLAEELPRQGELSEGLRPVSARATAVLIGDFYFDPALLSAFCASLAQREAGGLVIQITDPAERTLPHGGRVRFRDLEDPSAAILISRVESVRAAYEEKFQAHRRALEQAARGAGWRFLEFSTDLPAAAMLARVYEELRA